MKNIAFILLLLPGMYVTAARFDVGKNYAYPNIQTALLKASGNDSIFVHSGIYKEKNILISKPIYLEGIGWPVLDGENIYEVISIRANKVTVKGFTIQYSGISSITDFAGIKVYNSKHTSIINNRFFHCFFGIYIQNGTSCLIQNNLLCATNKEEQQSGDGIHCWKSDSLHIIGNSVMGHRDGIYFEFVTNSLIVKNVSGKNLRYGLHFMFSNDDVYIGNMFKANGAGVAVMFSHGIKMFRNFFEENWGDAAYGILLKEISDSHIAYNSFDQNTMAIYAEGANRIQVRMNNFKNNGWAMKIQASCMDMNIDYNNFSGNSFDIGTNGSLVLNTFNRNYWDKYEGYDLNKDGIGDICYRPVSMYSMIVEKNPTVMMLYRSVITTLMDKSEKIIPSLTPENLKDNHPMMKPLRL